MNEKLHAHLLRSNIMEIYVSILEGKVINFCLAESLPEAKTRLQYRPCMEVKTVTREEFSTLFARDIFPPKCN